MALVVPNVGEVRLMKYALKQTTAEDQVMKLYKNNLTPGETDVAGDYTEADFTGYTDVTLTGTDWSIATASGITTAVQSAVAFISSVDQTAQDIYGYYVVGASSGILLWSERFTDGPYTIALEDDTITITPKITGE
jgi:hypothetical protein